MENYVFLFTPLGFMLYEALRLYGRLQKGVGTIWPSDYGYYILMGVLIFLSTVAAYALKVSTSEYAIYLGFSFPCGFEVAMKNIKKIGVPEVDDMVDDIEPPIINSSRVNKFICFFQVKYFDA
jgi:hypothetical protein